MLLVSCKTDYEYSNNPCYFVFDNSVHLDNALASALNNNSGIFCYIYQATSAGVQYIYFQTNQGLSSKQKKNAVDEKRSIVLGINNGIIVGVANIDNIIYAYDHQCPNCAKNAGAYSPNYPLTMNTDGTATCAKCKRKYDLNNGGLVISDGGGDKLWRYRVTCTGPYGTLIVNN